jgi:hypothetical protein
MQYMRLINSNKAAAYLLCLACSGFMSSCVISTGALSIEKSEGFPEENDHIQSLVSLEPDFQKLDTRKAEEDKYLSSAEREEDFNDMLVRMAGESGIDLTVIDHNRLVENQMEYFNDECALRKEIFQANFYQVVSTENKYKIAPGIRSMFKAPWKIMSSEPRISSRFSYLAEKYNTPYFAVHGVQSFIRPIRNKAALVLFNPVEGIVSLIKTNSDTYYYTIITNVVTGRVIYREIRLCYERPTDGVLKPLIYDSFKIIKH